MLTNSPYLLFYFVSGTICWNICNTSNMSKDLLLVYVTDSDGNSSTSVRLKWVLQGDREEVLGLPISPLCDRKNTHVAESQIGKYSLYL